jgi:hypothetical protein
MAYNFVQMHPNPLILVLFDLARLDLSNDM